ncbi:MAG: nitrogenase [Proteobacteria bacterium]|nr:nitrogenase [Pseudomonadota bacterium]MBU1714198.1 nitrogenase [Pseudomonadota bacterium]
MPKYVSTTNACKLCKPLGACLAFRGIEGTVPYLHGSQGCATYMRRYIISHFNEPIDIASSSLGEKNAIYGGGANLKQGLKNVSDKYHPQLVGIATTCLTETIGDDLKMIIFEYKKEVPTDQPLPTLITVSTPSYAGTHMEGFHAAILSVLSSLCEKTPAHDRINILPGFLSPADLRLLKEIMTAFALPATILPDISDTLDGPALDEYQMIPAGGTPLAEIRKMGGARATIEFGSTLDQKSGGKYLEQTFEVANHRLTMPIGIKATDRFFELLENLSGENTPARYLGARGRLIDGLVDGHKYVFGKRAVLYGEEDLVVALAGFLAEIGVQPVLCASGGKSGKFQATVAAVTDGLCEDAPETYEDCDFHEIAERAEALAPDLIIGHSKGYQLARKLAIPLIRVGFPIHDRIGGQRILHIGYEGAQQLFDQIANAMIQVKQDRSPVGYSYM